MTATPFQPAGDYWQSQGFHAGHLALDMIGRDGQTAHAIAAGFVWQASWNGGGWAVGGGYTAIVLHGPRSRPTMKTGYAHGRGLYVGVGSPVLPGSRLIVCDNQGNSTGSHCHHSVELWDGSRWVSVDPHRVYNGHSWKNGSLGAGGLAGDARVKTTVKVTGSYVNLRSSATSAATLLATLRAGTLLVYDGSTSTGQAAFGTGSSRVWRRCLWWSGTRWVTGWMYAPLVALV